MSERDLFKLIESYLTGRLQGNDLRDFEILLEKDSSLSKAIEMHALAHNAIVDAGLLKVKAILDDIHTTSMGGSSNFGILFKGLIIFISAIGIATAIWFVFNQLNESSITHMFNQTESTKVIVKDKSNIVDDKGIGGMEKKDSVSGHINSNELGKSESQDQPSLMERGISGLYSNEWESRKNVLDQNLAIVKTDTFKVFKRIITDSLNESKILRMQEKDTLNLKNFGFNDLIRIDCDRINISFRISTVNSCNDVNNGIITIGGIKGGIPPYTFSINDWRRGRRNSIDNLSVGSYEVRVRDKNGCSGAKMVYIDKEDCSNRARFAPINGETWAIPGRKGVSGYFVVFNIRSHVVYRKKWLGAEALWDGRDLNGDYLNKGSYRYEINYDDSLKETGNVTIID